jgi:hypothetical protein
MGQKQGFIRFFQKFPKTILASYLKACHLQEKNITTEHERHTLDQAI